MSGAIQTRVVAVLDDIFFSSKIREAAKQANVNLEILKNTEGIIEALSSTQPKLIIVDLNSKKLSPLALIREIKSNSDLQAVHILGYLPHVEEDLKKEALLTGCDVVMPRSRFSKELVEILEKFTT